MVIQFRKSILPSLGLLLTALVAQPLWTALPGALTKLPSGTQTPLAPIRNPTSKRLPTSQSYGRYPSTSSPTRDRQTHK
jgi:hypothetical protein